MAPKETKIVLFMFRFKFLIQKHLIGPVGQVWGRQMVHVCVCVCVIREG